MPEKIPLDLSLRLPKEVKPLHYELLMHPDLEKGTFNGCVNILIDVLDNRGYIALHQKDLNITKTKLTLERDENQEIPIKETYTIEKLEVFVVSIQENINPGRYYLSLEFNGFLRPDKIVGFYSSKYKDSQDHERYQFTFMCKYMYYVYNIISSTPEIINLNIISQVYCYY